MERPVFFSRPVARKKYTCNACEWIENHVDYLFYGDFTYTELREIVKARRNNWCIVPGQQYIRAVQEYEGKLEVWRAIPAIHEICLKYDIYDYV
jgi:hypothetical protein